MKSRNIVLVTVGLAFSAGAYARYTDTQPMGTVSAWDQMTATVKVSVQVTVDKIFGFFNTPTENSVATVKPNQNQAHPVGTGTTAGVPANGPAPVAGQGAEPPSNQPSASPAPAVAAAPTPPPVNEAAQQLRKQALFESRVQGSSLQDVQSLRDKVKAASLLKVAQPGRAGTSNLPKSTAGVPLANWSQLRATKKIQRLDIGRENLISQEDFKVSSLSWGAQKPNEFKRLPSPAPLADGEYKKAIAIRVVNAKGKRSLQANIRTVGKPISQDSVERVRYKFLDVREFTALPYKPLSEEEMKMVAALILFDKGNHCHMIMGLFHHLASAPLTKIEATYHLGACAAQLKMNQSAFDHLSTVIASEDPEFAPAALGALAKDLPIIYEKDFFKLFKSLKNPKALLSSDTQDATYYRLAKGAYRTGDFKSSGAYAEMVSLKSEYSDDARFLSGMNSFALGDKNAALNKLQGLWVSVEPRKGTSGNSNIRALTSVNLARMYFALKRYDKALEHYMQVPKDHPLWVQALIEQGWTQLAMDDFSGAIGNMYSLHSPYFKAVYQPESFVVRTIGYLNICQYGDAYKSLSFLEKDYREWYGKTSIYLEHKGNPTDLYASVRNYIRGKSADDLEGVPYQVWREMAHRKDFLNVQTALNDKSDESRRYEGVNEKIKAEKASIRWRAEQAKKRFDQWRVQIARAKVDKSLSKNLDQWNASLNLERDLTIGYRFQLAILEQSREGYLDFQGKSQTKLNTESGTLSLRAGELLLGHAKNMQQEMSQVLDNNEFLRYEVFSGSGENIRYQVAGGQVDGTANRIPANIKPTKMLNWSFDGEFWEDEIGSYRSSLQNSCAVQTQEQAQHVNSDDEN